MIVAAGVLNCSHEHVNFSFTSYEKQKVSETPGGRGEPKKKIAPKPPVLYTSLTERQVQPVPPGRVRQRLARSLPTFPVPCFAETTAMEGRYLQRPDDRPLTGTD